MSTVEIEPILVEFQAEDGEGGRARGEVVAWLALTNGEKVVAGLAQFVGIPKSSVVAVIRGEDDRFYQRELWQLRALR